MKSLKFILILLLFLFPYFMVSLLKGDFLSYQKLFDLNPILGLLVVFPLLVPLIYILLKFFNWTKTLGNTQDDKEGVALTKYAFGNWFLLPIVTLALYISFYWLFEIVYFSERLKQYTVIILGSLIIISMCILWWVGNKLSNNR